MSIGLAGLALPRGWEWWPLKHGVRSVNRGSAPEYVDDGPVWAVSQAANQPGGLDWSRARFHAFSGNPAYLKGLLRPDDVLINSTGRGTLGRVGYFSGSPDGRTAMVDGHVTRVRVRQEVLHPRFAYHYLSSEPFQHYIYSALVVGATNQIELVGERLAAAPVALPPIEEQRRIADFLDGELERLNTIQSRRAAQRKLLEERVDAQISEELIPGILERPLRQGPRPWLPSLPDDLPLVRLRYVSRLQSGLTVDGARTLTGDVVTRPYLRVANVQAGYLRLGSIAEISIPRLLASRSTLRPGDVLMTEGGDLDKLGRGTVWRGELENCLHQNHVFALRPDRTKLDGDYLALVTRSLHARCYFESTGVKTTNLASTNSSKILAFPVPLPDLNRQRAIATELRRLLGSVERTRGLIDRQMARLQEHMQALITAAVTGQLDVSTGRRAA